MRAWRTRSVRWVLKEPIPAYAPARKRGASLADSVLTVYRADTAEARARLSMLRTTNSLRRCELLMEWGRLVGQLNRTPRGTFDRIDVLMQLGFVELQILQLGGKLPPRPR